jgi:diguanylate cyclase (GGDEF)-like protein
LKLVQFARNIRAHDLRIPGPRIEQNEMPQLRISLVSRCLLALLCAWPWALWAQGGKGLSDEVPRHPLEIKAITQPDEVLAEIPAALEAARKNHDMRTLALLYLAQANACRVIANWPCQRSAGGSAREAAVLASDSVLEVRGLIADSRASIAMQDFLRGERLLGEAELLLKKAPVPDLMSDVYLAYSSLSFTLNKFEISANYAQRGLDALPVGRELPTRARLLRNLGRAQAQLTQTEAAELSLQMARDYAAQLNDPKLSAELHLETARLAHLMQDAKMQNQSANAVLDLAKQLKNSQLEGQAREALGIAATDAKDSLAAEQQFRQAFASFNQLKLERDELRVLRLLIKLVTDAQRVPGDIANLSARNVALSMKIEQEDRAKAAADFDARLRFITNENELRQLKVEAEASKEREKLLMRNTHLAQLAAALVALVLIVLAGFFLQLRRNKRLQERLARIDALTGIANRRQFEERLATALARSKRQQIPLMLLAFDIDKFKTINDTHGHAVGDAVIVEFARRISSSVREGDLPARIGGDEFLVLIEDAMQPDVGMLIAEKILERMRQPMQIGALTLPVTSSIGVGFSKRPETTVALLDLADRALYAAKEAGRNTARLLQG